MFLGYNYRMRKSLLMLAVVVALIAAIVFVAHLNKDYDARGHHYRAKCADSSPQAAGVHSFVCEADDDNEAEESQPKVGWWHILITWPEGITTWAVILTLGAITWQAFLMRKHAEHFEMLAGATNKQADHVAASERAWILAGLSVPSGPNLSHWTDATGESKMTVSINIRCTNDGHSPAWITSKSARLVIVKEGEALPPVPQLTKEDVIDEVVEPVGPGKDSTPSEWNATGNGRHSTQTSTIIYGVVKYLDIFGENRETWFCYRLIGYQGNRKLIRISCGPEYSRHT